MSAAGWVQAARLPSNLNLQIPLILGQAWAYETTGAFAWGAAATLALYGWWDQLSIVFLNDLWDREADAANHDFNLFSGGSRVLPEGKLAPCDLALAGALAVALTLALALVWWLAWDLPHALPLALLGHGLLLLYSHPRLRINYKGGGELLQGLGCGALLPALGYYVQAGTWSGLPLLLLLAFTAIHTASSIATNLPDRPADLGVKRTLPVLVGLPWAASAAVVLCAAGVAGATLVAPTPATWSVASAALLIVAAWTHIPRLERDPRAIVAFDACVILTGVVFALGYV